MEAKKIKGVKSLSESIKDLMKVIEKTPLKDIPPAYLPPSVSKDFFFASYSHKDYKEVYRQLFLLNDEGMAFWYDRGIPAGSNWKQVVNSFMAPYACKGVLFFLSENALSSEAIAREMLSCIRFEKPYIPMMLPVVSELTLHGKSVKGKVLEPLELMEAMKESGMAMEPNIEKVYAAMFHQDLIFLSSDALPEANAEKIALNIKEIPLFQIHKDDVGTDLVASVNDLTVETIGMKELKASGCEGDYVDVAEAAFANCRYLTEFNAPVFRVHSYAFAGDVSLRKINFAGGTIGQASFKGCKNLLSFPFEELNYIPDSAFEECAKLEEVSFNGFKIGKKAFQDCVGLKKAFIGEETYEIALDAFDGCRSLEEIIVDPGNETYFSYDGVVLDKKTNKILIVPEKREVFDFNEIPNEGYDKGAFVAHDQLKRVVIGSDIAMVEPDSFYNCKGLKEAIIPSSVELIAAYAFAGCEGLDEVHIDASEVGDCSFYGCGVIKNLRIGPNVTWIHCNAFFDTTLLNIELHPDNECLSLFDSMIVDNEEKEAFVAGITEAITGSGNYEKIRNHLFAGSKTLCYVETPDSCREIEDRVFQECSALEEIRLNKGLEKIGKYAFAHCPIKEIHIPSSVAYIGEGAFIAGDDNLTITSDAPIFPTYKGVLYDVKNLVVIASSPSMEGEIGLPNDLKEIGDGAFYNCKRITAIHLPKNLRRIGSEAFGSCFALKEIELPDSLGEIDSFAFEGCGIAKLRLGPNVYEISSIAFRDSNIEDIEVDPLNPDFRGIDGILYGEGGTKLCCCPCRHKGLVDVPEGVIEVGDNAFFGCAEIDGIILPSTTRKIDFGAFADTECDIMIRTKKENVEIDDASSTEGYESILSRIRFIGE